MFWLGFIIGLFVGANIGIVVAGMLFSAKARDKALHPSERKDPANITTGINSETKKESSPPTRESAQIQKSFTDNTVS